MYIYINTENKSLHAWESPSPTSPSLSDIKITNYQERLHTPKRMLTGEQWSFDLGDVAVLELVLERRLDAHRHILWAHAVFDGRRIPARRCTQRKRSQTGQVRRDTGLA